MKFGGVTDWTVLQPDYDGGYFINLSKFIDIYTKTVNFNT